MNGLAKKSLGKKIMLFFTLLNCIAAVAQSPLQQRIDSLIDTYTGAQSFSGTILVAAGGKPVYERAFGYRHFADSTALQTTDVFELASVSKQFTAAIILMCKEKGLLKLDDSMAQYIQTPYSQITIRHLLTHTSGLPDYQELMDKHWDKTKIAGNEDIIAYLNKYQPPALFTPGYAYEYSNTGYVLLASIAEKASGKDFIALCRDWIFKPLRMKHTAIRTLAAKKQVKNFATGHIYVPQTARFVTADSFPSSNYTIWLGNRKGPGRVSSTAQDLLKWDRALYTENFISRATRAEAFAPTVLSNGKLSSYGFGWDILQHPELGKIVMHDGDNPGYKTQFIRCIDADKTIIVLSNNYADKMRELLQLLIEWIKK
jgi:CubicO group peptidase (beta-lactamase class C family)